MNTHSQTISRLTALWAFAESGIGGVLHGLRMPVTGFVLGAFAVVCMGLIAHHSTHRFRQLMQATMLVILVKAAASPHTPWPAYVAVGFQGVLGAVFFEIIPFYRLAALLVAVLALLESGLQKFLFAYLVAGKAGFEALDLLFADAMKFFGTDTALSFSWLMLAGYSGVFVLWGLVVGWWLGGLPAYLAGKAGKYRLSLPATSAPTETHKRRSRNRMWLLATVSLTLLLLPLAYAGGGYLVLRTLAILVFIYTVVSPLLSFLIKKWINRRKASHATKLNEMLELSAGIGNLAGPAWAAAGNNRRGIGRVRAFVLILLVNFVYAPNA